MNGEEIPLRPITRSEIHRLETALLVTTMIRPDVLEKIRSAEDRLTWIDSLAVAAGALAREKSGMPTSQIAEELGRTEATVRNHLSGRTEAGRLVQETYRQILEGKITPLLGVEEIERRSKLEEERNRLKEKLLSIAEEIKNIAEKL